VRAKFRGFRMERARRRKREQEEREARLRSHYVADSKERVQAEVAALVGLGGEDLSRRGEAAAALAQVMHDALCIQHTTSPSSAPCFSTMLLPCSISLAIAST
jgi:hypothetical protein